MEIALSATFTNEEPSIITNSCVRTLEIEIGKLENDNSFALFKINKKTLNTLVKLINRNEKMKKTYRDKYRNEKHLSNTKYRATDCSMEIIPVVLQSRIVLQ